MLATPLQDMNLGSPGRNDITFYSLGGEPVTADVYKPPAEEREWSLVVCPGYGSVKELMEPWGRSLAGLGYRVCVVGYRGYGGHPGEIGRIFPNDHVEDVRAAIRWTQTQQGRASANIAVMGVSYGGAVAIEAGALEVGVDAVISIVGYGSGSRHLRAIRQEFEWADLLERAREDRLSRVLTGSSGQVSLDQILLRDAEAQRWRERVESEYPGMRFDVTWESVDRLLEFCPDRYLPFDRRLPFLILQAEHDRVIPVSEASQLFRLADEPKRLVILEGAEHHDVHSGTSFQRCLEEVSRFLEEVSGRAATHPRGGTY